MAKTPDTVKVMEHGHRQVNIDKTANTAIFFEGPILPSVMPIVPYIFIELPTCVPVQCGLPESPENGKAHYTALAYKSVVTYTCKYGFMVVGDGTRTCGEDKRWSGQDPKCKEINCGSPGFLPNGMYNQAF